MPKPSTRANRREQRHPKLVGLPQAAEYCDVHYRTIRRWIAGGKLKAVRVGPRLLKVRAADLDALMQPIGGGDYEPAPPSNTAESIVAERIAELDGGATG